MLEVYFVYRNGARRRICKGDRVFLAGVLVRTIFVVAARDGAAVEISRV
jgi:hypothetical protein